MAKTLIGDKEFQIQGSGKLTAFKSRKGFFQIEGGEAIGGAQDSSELEFSFRFGQPTLIRSILHKAYRNVTGISGYEYLDCQCEINGITISPPPTLTNSIVGITLTSPDIILLQPGQSFQKYESEILVQGNQLVTVELFARAFVGSIWGAGDNVNQYFTLEYEV
jgi:hypothetical protein